jgi:undecaprenyl-diphosphatase
MHAIKLFVEALILHHGYSGIFVLTALDQFILPIPVDFIFGFSIEHGLFYGKLMLVVLAASLIGTTIGYLLGKYLGHPALTWLVGKKKVEKGEMIIKKWGIWGVIATGITPFPFKIIAWAAGIFEMPFGRFILGVLLGLMPRYLLTAYAGARFFETKFYATTDMSAIILGALQGITEFLPISSTGHLIIMEHFLRLPVPASHLVTFDIFLHGGSLVAIVLYFWKDWFQVLKECWNMVKKLRPDTNSLAFKLAAATVPAIFAGLFFGDALSNSWRDMHAVAVCFIITGFLYFYITWKGKDNSHEAVSLKNSILIGIAQVVALIPAISRSGMTIATGIGLGLTRKAAAKFSFLLGGIALLAANVYTLLTLSKTAPLPDLDFIMMGTVTSFFTSLLTIYLLMKLLDKYTLRPFGIYLILAGSFILSFL